MTRQVRVHPAAEQELDEAAAFYDLEDPGLGQAFIESQTGGRAGSLVAELVAGRSTGKTGRELRMWFEQAVRADSLRSRLNCKALV